MYEHATENGPLRMTFYVSSYVPAESCHGANNACSFGVEHVITNGAPCSVYLYFDPALVRVSIGVYQTERYCRS